ncbi:MAG: hypothetical protein ACLQOO_07545 [Terriglobia bacterium]
MRFDERLPKQVQDALGNGLLKRVPLTFLPFINQELRDWDHLFPYERQSVQGLLVYLSGLNDGQCAALFREVFELEEKMEVRRWQFSTDEQTIQNASLLARSAYYQDWRRAVQKVFDAAEQHGQRASDAGKAGNRLILLVIPQRLPLDPARVWQKWQGIGRPLKLDPTPPGETRSVSKILLGGVPGAAGGRSGGLLEVALGRSNGSPADTWVLDAGTELIDEVLGPEPSRASARSATMLGYDRLKPFRESFSHEMNSMRKDLADADSVFARLRQVDVTPWCPPEVASQPVIREFLRSLFLSGNGALMFGNSFVEWAASEAFRRARPTFLLANFGVRNKPKPFTGVVVFENPDQLNPLPSVEDPAGSALDAQMLALYTWLAASRYQEYQSHTACVCVAESLSQAYVIAPQEMSLGHDPQPISPARLGAALGSWLA